MTLCSSRDPGTRKDGNQGHFSFYADEAIEGASILEAQYGPNRAESGNEDALIYNPEDVVPAGVDIHIGQGSRGAPIVVESFYVD